MDYRPIWKYGLLALSALHLILLSACGGGAGGGNMGGGGGQPPPPPNFSVSSNASSVVLTPGADSSLTLSITAINAFTGQVDVALSGLPSGVTASPANLTLGAGGNQQITFSAAADTLFASTNVLINATSGSLAHNLQISLTISLVAPTSAYPPIRARYIRTDSFYDPNSLQYAPPRFTVYDSVDKRFFVSNPFLDVIDVFDAKVEIEIATIPVPGGPWGIDLSADNTILYAGTLLGDVYEIDAAKLTVMTRVPSSTIGPMGYSANEAFVLSDGRLALLGGLGAVFADGYPSFAIWNPKDNSLDLIGFNGLNSNAQNLCPGLINIGAFALSGDRTKVLLGSIDSDGTLCSYNPTTKQGTIGTFGEAMAEITPTPDGKRFFATSESGLVQVFDTTTVQKLGQFQGPVGPLNVANPYSLGIYGAVMSLDGKTLYVVDGLVDLVAYDTTSFAERGWVPNFRVIDSQQAIVPGAIDETGLIVGPIGHGVAFSDGSQFEPGTQSPDVGLGFLNPQFGPAQGGTTILVPTSTGVQNAVPGLSQVYLGSRQLTGASEISINNPQNVNIQGASPAPAAPGPADFGVVFSNGNVGLVPEGFSYGPSVVEIVPNTATADGGTVGTVFGYGFGATASGVQVTIGGKPAPITNLAPNLPFYPYIFPLEILQFTIPAGTAGANVDVTVSNSNGSVTVAAGFHYAKSAVIAPLTGSSLQEGIFDPHRSQYYFTDATVIRVLSQSGTWLAPFSIPGSTRLLALSLSPDGTKLAISDFGSKKIFVVNPGAPGSVASYPVSVSGSAPVGLAITDSGAVYYSTDNGQTDAFLFHKLDITNGSTTNITNFQDPGSPDADFVRVLVTPDGSRAFTVLEGTPLWVNTTDDQVTINVAAFSQTGGSAPDFAMSSDASTFVINGLVTDAGLNPSTIFEYTDREVFIPTAAVGLKLSKDGRLFFQPLIDGIDILDTQSGRLKYRVQIPGTIPQIYDALVTDGVDNTIAVIINDGVDLISLDPLQLPQGRVVEAPTTHVNSQIRHTPSRESKEILRRPHLKGRAAARTEILQ